MSSTLRIGMIGLDTSHCEAFAKLLHDPSNPHHVPGGRIVAAYPGGSSDFAPSRDRVEGITERIRDQHGVAIVGSPEEAAEGCDALIITSVDGRVHLEQLRQVASFGKPVFVDKPCANSSKDAQAMFELAEKSGFPLMSASSLRYAQPYKELVEEASAHAVIGADCAGPMNLVEPANPGLFWYGVHTVEMLYGIMGAGCVSVTAYNEGEHEFAIGRWRDGRIGTMRGNRKGNNKFLATIHTEKQSYFCSAYEHPKPAYAGILESVMEMFRTGKPPIDPKETIEITRFLEAANESRGSGREVKL